jgi:hypothetical protein
VNMSVSAAHRGHLARDINAIDLSLGDDRAALAVALRERF